MNPDVESQLDRADQAARGITDPAAREAIEALIAAVRGWSGTPDYRSADLQ